MKALRDAQAQPELEVEREPAELPKVGAWLQSIKLSAFVDALQAIGYDEDFFGAVVCMRCYMYGTRPTVI